MRHYSLTLCSAALALAIVLLILAWTVMRPSPRPTLGVVVNEPDACEGYTLVFPLSSTKTYLIDMQGRVVRTWQSKYMAGQDAYLLENGHLLRSADLGENEAFFAGASKGGRIQEFTWDGELVWDYRYHNQTQLRHHAITRLPNGNILMIVWDRKTLSEVMAAGVRRELLGKTDVLVDALVEVQPTGKTGGKIAWLWRVWDHLIQDEDRSRPNYGDVAAHPELIDVNFGRHPGGAFMGSFPPQRAKTGKSTGDSNLQRLKSLGYVGASSGHQFGGYFPDWPHLNSVAYNPHLDQIMLSARELSEVWIIDHSTTTAEAATHQGGRYGKGGDLLYRWGNPQAYQARLAGDQQLFHQHDALWIPDGLPGEGNLLVFNNGNGRPGGVYSSVDEVMLPVDAEGRYPHRPGTAFGPREPLWSYTAPTKSQFFSMFMSGAQRLRNGNTLIATGYDGTIFEVTPQKEVVWKYLVPMDFERDRDTTEPFAGEGNPIFRAYRYTPDYLGLAKRDLTPGKTIEELERKDGPAPDRVVP
jgi:hypothetical protein